MPTKKLPVNGPEGATRSGKGVMANGTGQAAPLSDQRAVRNRSRRRATQAHDGD